MQREKRTLIQSVKWKQIGLSLFAPFNRWHDRIHRLYAAVNVLFIYCYVYISRYYGRVYILKYRILYDIYMRRPMARCQDKASNSIHLSENIDGASFFFCFWLQNWLELADLARMCRITLTTSS